MLSTEDSKFAEVFLDTFVRPFYWYWIMLSTEDSNFAEVFLYFCQTLFIDIELCYLLKKAILLRMHL